MRTPLQRLLAWFERYELVFMIGIPVTALCASVYLVLRLWGASEGFVAGLDVSIDEAQGFSDIIAAYSAAGDFYNLRFGVSVAVASGVFGSAIALVLTYFATKAARRQGDVQLLEFVDSRIADIRRLQPLLSKALKELNVPTNWFMGNIDEVRMRVIQIRRAAGSPPPRVSDILLREPDFETYRDQTETFIQRAANLSQVTQDVANNGYVEALMFRRTEAATSETNPFLYMFENFPMSAELTKSGIGYYKSCSEDPYESLNRLSELSEMTRISEPFFAEDACNDSYSTIYLAGAIIHHSSVEIMDMDDAEEGQVVEVTFNFGAALLIWLFSILRVSNEDIVGLYSDLFKSRADALKRYLESVPVYPGASHSWMARYHNVFSDFSPLISVTYMNNGIPCSVPYDASRFPGLDQAVHDALLKEEN